MSAEHLTLCENAKKRAEMYLSIGEAASACEAYLEAARHMLQVAESLQGQQKLLAQQLTEQLLIKAKQAKTEASACPPVYTPDPASAPVPAFPDMPAPVFPDMAAPAAPAVAYSGAPVPAFPDMPAPVFPDMAAPAAPILPIFSDEPELPAPAVPAAPVVPGPAPVDNHSVDSLDSFCFPGSWDSENKL